MNILVFNGAEGIGYGSTGDAITGFLNEKIASLGALATIYNLDDADLPMFSTTKEPSASVTDMVSAFLKADAHIWLSPLYHGGIPGSMKNCLDWLELSSKYNIPYLTDKKIGLVCWADGSHAMQGINNMDAVAKALRGWTLPYSIPASKQALLTEDRQVSYEYKCKFDIMLDLLIK